MNTHFICLIKFIYFISTHRYCWTTTAMSNLRERIENKTKIAIEAKDAFYFESQNELLSYQDVDVSCFILTSNSISNTLSISSN